jgi:hypothetical protein
MSEIKSSEVQDVAVPHRIYVNRKAAAIPMSGVYTLSSHADDAEYALVDPRSAEAVAGLEAALAVLLNGLPVFPESDSSETVIQPHHLGLVTVGQILAARAALKSYEEVTERLK